MVLHIKLVALPKVFGLIERILSALTDERETQITLKKKKNTKKGGGGEGSTAFLTLLY